MPALHRRPSTWLIVFGLAVTTSAARAQPPKGGPPQAKPVVAAPVVVDEIESGQMFVGTVMPLKRAAIGSAVDGRVTAFPVNEGDRVEKGETLAQLLTETIRLQVEAAEAELDLRREELAELRAGSRPEEIEQARARMAAAKAQMDYAKARLQRAESLFQQGRAISKEEVDEAFSASENASESYLEAKAAHQLAVEGPRKEKIAQAVANVAAQEAQVSLLKDQFKKHTIITQFDGYVVAEHTEVGQWVNRGELVAEVVALDQVDVQAHVLEKHIPYIQLGREVRVEIPALPDDVFVGKIALIVPQADVRSRTFPVKVRLDNPPGKSGPRIKAGMLARVQLATGGAEAATLVPKDALVLGGASPMIYVIDFEAKDGKQGKARPVPVQLGGTKDALIQVKGDVKEGQRVVVIGNERLRPGEDVAVIRELKPGETLSPAAVRTAGP